MAARRTTPAVTRALTLKARHALWGRAPDGGAAARFESVDDDANVFVGPLNHPKLMLKPCTREWTVEAWIRYTGPWGGFGRYNATYAHLCGSSEEGYHLSHIGVRAGFQFLLEGGNAPDAGHGLLPTSRYEGNFAGKDPNYDVHYMADLEPALAAKDADGIRDERWHHVAWQFRFRDQMHVLFVDGTPVRRIQPYRKIFNDTDEHVGVPFMVGGILCWSDPPWPGRGNFVGEMYDLRISDVMRYPVSDRLSIVGGPGFSPCDVYDDESLRAGFRFGTEALPFAVPSVPYRVELAADGADGSVRWELSDGRLPNGLELREDGIVEGTVRGYVDRDAHFTVNATDQGGQCDSHGFRHRHPHGHDHDRSPAARVRRGGISIPAGKQVHGGACHVGGDFRKASRWDRPGGSLRRTEGRAGGPRHLRVPGGGRGLRGCQGDTRLWRFGCFPGSCIASRPMRTPCSCTAGRTKTCCTPGMPWETRS